MGPTVEMSGGSVANSIAGVAALGGTCGYIGKVADDDFGERFTHDLRRLGVELDLADRAARRGRDRALPRLHHRRRPAHDGDVPGRVEPAARRGHQRPADRALGDHLRRGLPLRPAAGQGGDSAASSTSPTSTTRWSRCRCRTCSASTATAATSSTSSPTTSTSCCATRPRCCRSSGRTTSSSAFDALDELGLLAVVTRGPRGADVLTVDGRRERAGARGRARRRPERRRRHVRRRLPLRPGPRGRPRRGGRPGVAVRRGDHPAPRRAARGRPRELAGAAGLL